MADLVKTTLGPCGLDKILQSVSENDQSISVTNDGATILRKVHVDNAAARVLVDMSKVQDDEIGDGTTSVVVLAGELLKQAESLVLEQRLHPQTVAAGWREALKVAQDALKKHADELKESGDQKDHLLQIASTTLSSKLLTYEKELFAKLAVDAVLRLDTKDPNMQHIQVLKKPGGSLRDSYLEEGFLLDQKSAGVGQPRKVQAESPEKPLRVLLGNTSLDTDKIKIYGSRVQVDSLDKVAAVEQAEKAKLRKKVENIIDHKIDCFVNRQLIYNYPESLFTAAGVMAIEHADFDGIERLAAVLGGEVVSTFDQRTSIVGECKVIEEVFIGEDKVLRFGGCKSGQACSIVLRGASTHVLDEAERSLHDALCILIKAVQDDHQTVYGGGCTEILMAAAIDRAAEQTPGKKALAMTAFAKALRQLPMTVADNGGFDAAELVTQLRAAHAASNSTAGLDMAKGEVGNMKELGIREAYASKRHVITSAAEAAEMILRVDDIIKAAPRKRSEQGY